MAQTSNFTKIFAIFLNSLLLVHAGSLKNVVSSIEFEGSLKNVASSTATLGVKQGTITAPYGSWKSNITADVAARRTSLTDFAVDSLGRLFLVLSGQLVLYKQSNRPGDEAIYITPKNFSVHSKALDFGGGAFSIFGENIIFSNSEDQRLYKQSIISGDATIVPITPYYEKPVVVSYADGVYDSRLNRYVTIREDGRASRLNPNVTIVTIDLNANCIKEPKVLVGGNDFYAFPRIDSKGERMAWIEWGHPNMPWDKSQLWVGYFSENGDVYKRICVAGCHPAIVESPTEPKWSPQGELFFITDRKNGFWNLYKWIECKNEVVPVHSMDAEFTRPLWQFGINSYEFIQNQDGKNLIACSYRQNGRSYVGLIDEVHNSLSLLDIPFTDVNNMASENHYLYIHGATAVHPLSLAQVTLDNHLSKVVDSNIIWSSSPNSEKYASYFSLPELIKFPTEVQGQYAFAFFYPPSNPYYQANPEEKPPLLLRSHGGPTSEAREYLNLEIQYWTSRGWAFVDVNYGGSTGYGREYRERLMSRWGIVDVNDCCSCAKFLVDSGKVDGKRLCITGESSGGFTTLAALAFKDTFKAGTSLFGVSDLSILSDETHKFESHYLETLVGSKKDYFERSPINFIDKFSGPVFLFHGQNDTHVPPNQSSKMYEALKCHGLPVAHIEYPNEGHGFSAKNRTNTLEQQMVFFARTVGHFNVADEITPHKIDNFD